MNKVAVITLITISAIALLSLLLYLIFRGNGDEATSSPTTEQTEQSEQSEQTTSAPDASQLANLECMKCLSNKPRLNGVREGRCTKESSLDCPPCPDSCPRYIHQNRARSDMISRATPYPGYVPPASAEQDIPKCSFAKKQLAHKQLGKTVPGSTAKRPWDEVDPGNDVFGKCDRDHVHNNCLRSARCSETQSTNRQAPGYSTVGNNGASGCETEVKVPDCAAMCVGGSDSNRACSSPSDCSSGNCSDQHCRSVHRCPVSCCADAISETTA